MQQAAPRLVRDIATAHGLTASAEFRDGYPVTVNDTAEMAFAEQTVTDVLGDGHYITAPDPLTGAEDFSYVLEQVPGAYLMVGACPPGADPFTAPFNHSAEAVFDDAALTDGTALYTELALRRLADVLRWADRSRHGFLVRGSRRPPAWPGPRPRPRGARRARTR